MGTFGFSFLRIAATDLELVMTSSQQVWQNLRGSYEFLEISCSQEWQKQSHKKIHRSDKLQETNLFLGQKNEPTISGKVCKWTADLAPFFPIWAVHWRPRGVSMAMFVLSFHAISASHKFSGISLRDCTQCTLRPPALKKMFEEPSLKLTFSHLKIGRAPKGNNRIPTIHIFRCELLVSGRVSECHDFD